MSYAEAIKSAGTLQVLIFGITSIASRSKEARFFICDFAMAITPCSRSDGKLLLVLLISSAAFAMLEKGLSSASALRRVSRYA